MGKSIMSMELPKVGDNLFRIMTASGYDPNELYTPEPCVVTYVNEKNGWYEVLFKNSNVRECYNIPSFDHSIMKDKRSRGTPVLCFETGYVYSSMRECAHDMGIDHSGITRQTTGICDQYKGYHFFKVL